MAYTGYPVWSLRPTWNEGILERLAWKTDVLSSEVREEQRISRRLTPRRAFETKFIIRGSERQEWMNFINTVATPVLIPIWPELSSLASGSALQPTDHAISLDYEAERFSSLVDLQTGDLAILLSTTSDSYEVVEILSVAVDDINKSIVLYTPVGKPIEGVWLSGAVRICPAVPAAIETHSVIKGTDEVEILRVEFRVNQANAERSDWQPPTFYGGPVVSVRPDDSKDIAFPWDRIRVSMDNDLSKNQHVDLHPSPTRRMGYHWSFVGKEKNYLLRKQLYWLRGRNLAVWLPTWMSDLTLLDGYAHPSVTLRIKRVGYTALGATGLRFRFICVELKSGKQLYAGVQNSAIDPQDDSAEFLFLYDPIVDGGDAANFSADEVARVSYMHIVRLDQDSIEVSHETGSAGLTMCSVVWSELSVSGANMDIPTGDPPGGDPPGGDPPGGGGPPWPPGTWPPRDTLPPGPPPNIVVIPPVDVIPDIPTLSGVHSGFLRRITYYSVGGVVPRLYYYWYKVTPNPCTVAPPAYYDMETPTDYAVEKYIIDYVSSGISDEYGLILQRHGVTSVVLTQCTHNILLSDGAFEHYTDPPAFSTRLRLTTASPGITGIGILSEDTVLAAEKTLYTGEGGWCGTGIHFVGEATDFGKSWGIDAPDPNLDEYKLFRRIYLHSLDPGELYEGWPTASCFFKTIITWRVESNGTHTLIGDELVFTTKLEAGTAYNDPLYQQWGYKYYESF